MIPGQRFDPATETSRRPTPERFEHLRRWVEPIEHNIAMTSITELTNVNQQIDQISRFYVNNIVQRAIAQMVAASDGGFTSLRATEDGALHVAITGSSAPVMRAAINFAAAGDNEIVAAVEDRQICIDTLMMTIAGECNLTLQSGENAMSGPLDFGGANEPRGMVCSFNGYPLKTGAGQPFCINASTAVQVSGYITYHLE